MLRCLIATLGKDAPGVNAFVRAATRLALRSNLEVYGARRGFAGILRGEFHKMKQSDVGHVLGKGGSLLGSTDLRVPPGDDETIGRLADALGKFDLVAAAGGLGSFSILNRVYTTQNMGTTTTLFVPASIENEFLDPRGAAGGDGNVHGEAIGADTAANTAIRAIDRLREQSYMSRTVFLVECVGLKSNYLPIQIGAGCGAHRIYLPRFPELSEEARAEIRKLFGGGFDPNCVDVRELVSWIETMFERGNRSYLVVIVPNGTPLLTMSARHERVAAAENYETIVTSMAPLELTLLQLVDQLMMHFAGNPEVQTRYVVIDDLQLGGSPSARDRMLGSLYGEAAIEEFLAILNSQEVEKRGNLNLLAIDSTTSVRWKCFRRQEVTSLYLASPPRAGGLDPLPFFRQMRGTVSGYRPWAEL